MIETFDFHSMQINWRGKQYPFREIDMEDDQYYVLVSVVDLERVLLGANDMPVDKSAEYLVKRLRSVLHDCVSDTLSAAAFRFQYVSGQ